MINPNDVVSRSKSTCRYSELDTNLCNALEYFNFMQPSNSTNNLLLSLEEDLKDFDKSKLKYTNEELYDMPNHQVMGQLFRDDESHIDYNLQAYMRNISRLALDSKNIRRIAPSYGFRHNSSPNAAYVYNTSQRLDDTAKNGRFLQISSCLFFSFQPDLEFSNYKYYSYLITRFNLLNSYCHFYCPYKPASHYGMPRTEFIETSYNELREYAYELRGKTIWTRMLNYSGKLEPEVFKDRYLQGKKFDTFLSGEIAILRFDQFAQLSGFIISMFIRSRPKKLISVHKLMLSGYYCCRFQNNKTVAMAKKSNVPESSSCTRNIRLLIDNIHRIIILQFEGKHGDDCADLNRRHGIQAFRNVWASQEYDSVIDVKSHLMESFGSDYEDILMQMGDVPTQPQLYSWKKEREKFLFNP